jgi:pyruvate-formate lyase-activating enzyme
VSLTGGEPLLQPDAVSALAQLIRGERRRVYLETHGLLAEALEQVADQIDVVSMDWKLASDVRRATDRRGEPAKPFHDAHERFLRAALQTPEVIVKVVVTPHTEDAELEEVCRRIAALAPETTLVLQPVTPWGRVRKAPTGGQLLAWQRACSAHLRVVRVIPQTHRMYGAL